MKVKIRDIPLNERPMERLINKGTEHLSNEELLAIIIRTGNKEVSSKVLSSYILKEVGGIRNFKKTNYQSLLKIKGIGKTKACSILALIELANRMNEVIEEINNIKLTTPEIVFEYYKNKFIDKKQEYFYCLYLDNDKKVICEKLHYIGTINHSLIHPREIYKEAYLVSASGIICIHNHPSGNVLPSKEDINITILLKQIGELFGIKIVDHIIIGKTKYYSFIENGDL